MTIGDRIKKRRLELKLVQEDVAVIVGVTKQTIQKYENNIITNIPSDKIELIAKALNITPAYLMGWEDNKKAEEAKIPVDYLVGNTDIKKQTAPEERPVVAELMNVASDLSIDDLNKIVEYARLLKLQQDQSKS